MRKSTFILDNSFFEFFNYERLFHPVQCNGCKICQCSSIDKLHLPRVTGILSTSDQQQYLRVINCFGNGIQQFSTCLFVLKFTDSLFLPIHIVHFEQEISFSESDSSMSANCCISTTVSVMVSGEVFGAVSKT